MEDLIRRSNAIDAVIEWYGCKPNDIEAFEKIIEAIPSAESTGDLDNAIYEYVKEGLMANPYNRPQGEWIVSDKDSVCSVCGKDEAEFICGTEDWYGYGLSNYCPNCGTRMKGADDE